MMGNPIWNMTAMTCGECGIEFAVPDGFYEERKKRGPALNWHCPNGHVRVFRECEADKLKRDNDRLQQRLAQKDDELKDLENRRRAAVGQVTKLRKRAAGGVCPCCNRTFLNMQRHMKTKHPNVVPLGQKTA